MQCPKCGRDVKVGAFICPGCEFILDTSFLGDDITDDEREKRVAPASMPSAVGAAVSSRSKSGEFGEDASILGFPAIAIRRSTEKAESVDAGHTIISGLDPENVLRNVAIAVEDPVDLTKSPMPLEYQPLNVSSKVVRIVVGMAKLVDSLVWGNKKHG